MTDPDQPAPAENFEQSVAAFQADYTRIVDAIGEVIVGHHHAVDDVLTCLLSGGHALLEGVPGLGKTLLVRTLGQALDLSFSRIQFTPDLMPADITGTNVVVDDDRGGKAFEFQRGPIFAHLVLADEINRATPKTQSAVLEAMQEQTVSVARTTRKLPQPFMVLATQNPLEMEGTYPLPEAQLDRFMLKILVSAPDARELQTILTRTTGREDTASPQIAGADRLGEMRQIVRRIAMPESVAAYVARLTLATDPKTPDAPDITRKYIRYGASPRGAQAMVLAAKVLTLRDGRGNVAFDDIRSVAPAALRHRLILSFEGQADGITPDHLITEILQQTPTD